MPGQADITFNTYTPPLSGSFDGVTYTTGLSGIYLITVCVANTGCNSTASIGIELKINSSTISYGSCDDSNRYLCSSLGRSNLTMVVNLSVGDLIKIHAQNSTVNNTFTTTDGTTRFVLTKLN